MSISKSHAKGMVILHTISLLVVLFSFFAFVKITSEELVYIESEGSMIGVSGFTNLNSWRMETKELNLDAKVVIASGNLKEIKSLKFITPVISLKSTHPSMDSVVYNMLIANGYDEITFVQKRQMVLPKMKMVNIIGDLTIGKVKRTIDLQLAYDVINDHEIKFKGLKKLSLNEFGITRLNPILKRIKFDNQVMIQIEMSLNNSSNIKIKTED